MSSAERDVVAVGISGGFQRVFLSLV